MFKKIFNLIKIFLSSTIKNISNICILLAIIGMLYSPLILLKANNYFDILKYCLIFIFFLIDGLIIGNKK